MIEVMTRAGTWLLQRSVALPETLYTRQIVTPPGAFDRMVNVASGLLIITCLLLLIGIALAAVLFGRRLRHINDLLQRLYGDVQPVIGKAKAVADNVEFISGAVREDVKKVSATVNVANERLRHAVRLTESRLTDISALLDVVQEEAEHLFISSAALVRGVRTGAEALSGDGDGTKFASGEDDGDLDRPRADEEADTAEQESRDGHERYTGSAEDSRARPRIRPRPGRGEARGRSGASESKKGDPHRA